MSVIVRKATALDIPFLQAELNKTNWERVDLNRSLVWIAEYNGQPFMFAALRLIWQLEPILKFRSKGIPKNAQRRGMYLLYKAVEGHIFDPEQNKTGIFFMFAHTTIKKVWEWAKVMGWHRCYKGGWQMIRWYGSENYKNPKEKEVPQRLREVVQEAEQGQE
jgi:hypothetical protein